MGNKETEARLTSSRTETSSNTNRATFQLRKPRFKRRCKELKRHIFNCSDSKQVNKYPTTLKEIINYTGKNYKQGKDTTTLLKTYMYFTIPPLNSAAPRGITDQSVIVDNNKQRVA
eukprot:5409473-Ditylum_brightwellii.AAC.1